MAVVIGDGDDLVIRQTRIRDNFSRAINISVQTITEAGKGDRYQFELSGFKFDDFDRNGYIPPHRIAKLFEIIRFTGRERTATFSSFLIGHNIEFTRDLYEHAAMDFPLVVDLRRLHAGKTSYSMEQRVTHKITGALIVKRAFTAVSMDLKTRRPLPLTEAYREKFSVEHSSPPTLVQPIHNIPGHSLSCTFFVREDDTDLYDHTTQSVYVLYAIECSALAVRSKFYSVVHEFSLPYRLRVFHSGESTVDDELTVITWDDEVNANITRFLMRKASDGRDVCYIEIEYYPDKGNSAMAVNLSPGATSVQENDTITRTSGKLAMANKRFSRVSNIPPSPTITGDGYEIRLSGFKNDDLDRTGKPALHKLIKVIGSSRFSGASGVDFSTFILGYDMEICRELYEQFMVNFPMILSQRINNLKRTSLTVEQKLTKFPDKTILVKRLVTTVCVNLATRKPQPIPDDFRDRFEKISMNFEPIALPKLISPFASVPTHSFQCSLFVRTDELDLFDHAMQASYVLYAVECSARAVRVKYYHSLHEFSLPCRLRVLHVGESRVSDELIVITWDDEVNPYLARFVIRKANDGRDVCYVEIEYYPNEIKSSL